MALAAPVAPAGWDCHVHVFDATAPCLPGHYAPKDQPLSRIEALAAGHGKGHLVLVQPSIYGTDNAVMLRALQATPGRHRGIAVVDAAVTEAELDAWHAAGVRGVRINLVSPVGNSDAALGQLAPRLKARGWHVQWYPKPHHLPSVAQWQAKTQLTFVLDHVAGIPVDEPVPPDAWQALRQLADAGAWLKLSGWYRLGAQVKASALVERVQQVALLFGDRLVWGSDWPHTSLGAATPSYAGLFAPVTAALGPDVAAEVACDHPVRLYA